MKSFDVSRGRLVGRAVAACRAGADRLADQADLDGRALSAGRRERRRGAGLCREAFGRTRQARHRRQPRRRRDHRRLQLRRQGGTRRLHDLCRRHLAGDQSDAHRPGAVRPAQELRARLADVVHALHPARQHRLPGQEHGRADRHRESQSRQVQHRELGHRRHQPSRRRAAEGAGRSQSGACALQGRRAGRPGRGGRPGADDVLGLARGQAIAGVRQDARHRHLEPAALARLSRHSDRRRSRRG